MRKAKLRSRLLRTFTYILLTVCWLSVNTGKGQTPAFNWAKSIGGTGIDMGFSVALDANGNVYVAGRFEGGADFDPGPGTFNMVSSGSNDIFVLKLDASGNFVWAKSMGSNGDDQGLGIAVDPAGDVYTTGWFQNTADFDPGTGVFNLTSAGSFDIFACKLDTNGNLVWAKSIGGADVDIGRSLTIDASGNVVITGRFDGTIDFDPGPGIFNLTSTADTQDIFALKFDTSGNFIWAKGMGGDENEDEGLSIATDAFDNVYITGSYESSADFDPGTGIFNLTSEGTEDIFVSKLDASGNFVWAKSVGGTDDDNGLSIEVDATGNVYASGFYSAVADFDPGTGTFNLTPSGGDDIFILKLDPSGNFIWAKSMGGTDGDNALAAALDATGIYTTGYFEGTADFDPGAASFNLTATGSRDIFISKLDASGNFVWAGVLSGTSLTAGRSITTDASGNIYSTGSYIFTVDFDPGPGTFNVTYEGNATLNSDGYILKLATATSALTITNFTPSMGPVGTTVTITGTDFDATPANNIVRFNGTLATPTASSPTSITTSVPPGASTGVITVTVGGNTATSASSFTVSAPAIIFTTQPSSASVCAESSVNFTAVASGDTNLAYQWQIDNAGFVDLANDATYSGVNLPTLTISNVSPSLDGANFRVLVRGDATVDTPSSTASLTVNPAPVSPATTGSSGCALSPITLTASGGMDGQYRWYFSATGGTAIAGAVNSTLTNDTLSMSASYFVAISDGSCESSRTAVMATVNEPPSPPSVIGAALCAPGSFLLNATGSTDGNYRWYDAASGGVAIPGELNETFTTPVLAVTTSYYVSIHNGVCESPRAEAIAVIHTPPAKPAISSNITPVAGTITICGNALAVLEAPSGFIAYSWSDGSISQQVTISSGGVYSVQVIDGNNCSSISSDPINVVVDPAICNTAPTIASPVTIAQVDGVVIISLVELVSDEEDNIDLTTLKIVSLPQSGATATIDETYSLVLNYEGIPFAGMDYLIIEVCDLLGSCTQAQLSTEVTGEIEICNAVSPNGDNLNDFFLIRYVDLFDDTRNNHVTIFNRWGDVVFETDNYNNTTNVFNGSGHNGKALPSGTYFYKIDFGQSRKLQAGFLMLKR